MRPAEALSELAAGAERAEAVVRDFAAASDEERRAFRAGLTREHCGALFAWAGPRGATAGLRERDPELLTLGLVGLSMLDFGEFDVRDALAVVPLYKQAAADIGSSPEAMFDAAVAQTDAPGAEWLRPLRDTPWTVEGGNYRKRRDADGARFESAYPDFDAEALEAEFGESSPGAQLPDPPPEPSRPWRDRLLRALRLQ